MSGFVLVHKDGSMDLCDGHHWITLPKAWVDAIVLAREHTPIGWVSMRPVECGPVKVEPVANVAVAVKVTISPIVTGTGAGEASNG